MNKRITGMLSALAVASGILPQAITVAAATAPNLEYGETYLSESFDGSVALNYHNGANAISENDKTKAQAKQTTVEVTDGKLKLARAEKSTASDNPELPVKFDLSEKVTSGLVAVSADIRFETNGDNSSYALSVSQLINPLTSSYVQVNGAKDYSFTAASFTEEKNLTVLLDIDNNTESLWVDGVKTLEGISNPQYASGIENLVIKIPRATGKCIVYIDNLTVKEVIKSSVENKSSVNFNDGTASGFTLSGVTSYPSETSLFGYNKYLSTTGSAEYACDITPSGDDFKSVYSLDLKAAPGTSVKLMDGNTVALSLDLENNSPQIQWTGQRDNVGTYTEGKWYHARIEVIHKSGGSTVNTAELYLDGISRGSTSFNAESISKVSILGESISIDNFRIDTIVDASDISAAPDILELRHEIQYAKDLIAYYAIKNMNSNTESVESRYFVDASDATEESGYLGGTYYAKYKTAVSAAESVYNSENISNKAIREAIDGMWMNIARVGGDIREIRFDDGLNVGYSGAGTIAEDSYPTHNKYIMKISGEGAFKFAPIPAGMGNLSTWGKSSRFNVSFDVKLPEIGETVIYLGEKSDSIFKIKLSAEDGKLYYYNNGWTASSAELEGGKWYSIYLSAYMVNSQNSAVRNCNISVDGVQAAQNIPFTSGNANTEISSLYIEPDSGVTVGIDNILAVKQYSNLPAGDRGLLGKTIRDAYDILDEYKGVIGTSGGQELQDAYYELETEMNSWLGRYITYKTLRVTTLKDSAGFIKQINTDNDKIQAKIAAFNEVSGSFADWYLAGVTYENSSGDAVLSAGAGDKIKSVKVLRYAETVEDDTSLITAIYDKNEKMLSYAETPLTNSMERKTVTEIPVDMTVPQDNCIIKCFIWNMNNIYPCTQPWENEKLKDGAINIFVLGDSIAARYTENNIPKMADGTVLYGITGIGMTLSNYFDSSRVTVQNDASPGATTYQFLRYSQYYDTTLANAQEGDYFIISFGHNDSRPDSPNRLERSDYKKYLSQMVQRAAAKGIHCILYTPPVRPNIGVSPQTYADALRDYSDAMLEVASELNVPCFDLNALSAQELKDNVGYFNDRYLIDGTHLTYYGADVYAGYIADYIKNMQHPLHETVVVHSVDAPTAN